MRPKWAAVCELEMERATECAANSAVPNAVQSAGKRDDEKRDAGDASEEHTEMQLQKNCTRPARSERLIIGMVAGERNKKDH